MQVEYYYPPAPKKTYKGFSEDGWQMEPKHNGDRVVAIKRFGVLSLWSRHGSLLSNSRGTEQLAALLKNLPDNVYIEGEWVRAKNSYHVFDSLTTPQGWCPRSVAKKPLYQRQLVAKQVVDLNNNPNVKIVEIVYSDFDFHYNRFFEEGHEGVVWKRIDGYYALGYRDNQETSLMLKRRFEWDRSLDTS